MQNNLPTAQELSRIELYQCRLCEGIYQTIVTECDCTVGKRFLYRILYAYSDSFPAFCRELMAKIESMAEALEKCEQLRYIDIHGVMPLAAKTLADIKPLLDLIKASEVKNG